MAYRSQFVLGPRAVEGLEDWTRTRLGRGLTLSTHPDLDVTYAGDGNREIALLGCLLDPFKPAATNAELVADLLRELAAGTDLLVRTARFGGRWILVVDDGTDLRMFHDAVGLRQIFYTDVQHTGELWCASQPGMVARLLGLKMNEDALGLIAADARPSREYRLPGESSAYVGVKRLLPNHYLDLTSGRNHRYWPRHRLASLDFTIAVESAAAILQGLMESASRRFPLAISMTGGRDSRLLLASARRVAGQASLVTVAKPGRAEDVEIPAKLLPRLGLAHTVIPWPSDVDEDFTAVFRKNVDLAHEVYVPEAFAVFAYNGLAKVAVTGSVAELVRPPSRLSRFGEDNDEAITALYLSTKAQMGTNRLALDTFSAWLASVPKLGCPSVLELYRWEGVNWLATTQAEFDMGWRDIITPYNCRLLLETMMAVPHKMRCGPRYRLAEALMRHLWPDVLLESFTERRRASNITPARIRRAVRLVVRRVSGRALGLWDGR